MANARTEDATALIKERVQVPQLARMLGVRVLANERLAHCFNATAHRHGDRNPSLQLFADGFVCHGCGLKGDAFDLVQHIEGCDFVAAKQRLSALVGLDAAPPAFINRRRPVAMPVVQPRQEMSPPPARLRAMERLWHLVEKLPLADSATSWLQSRGIQPALAHEIGCRNLQPVAAEIGSLVRGLPEGDRPLTGLYKDGKLWYPLAQTIAGHAASVAGLCFPCFVPDHAFPISWRWRFYQPLNFNSGKRPLKVMAQPSAGLPVLPLGLRRAAGHDLVFIVEGEPDYLSVLEASCRLQGCTIEAVAICDMSTGWRTEWTPHLDKARSIVVAVHDTINGRRLAKDLAISLIERHGQRKTERIFCRRLFDESEDANDLLRTGALVPWLSNWFEWWRAQA